MPLPIYLAMTAAEFRQNPTISGKIGWMACHFSPYGTGLSNCPTELPHGSMLILNDRTPVCGHDPALIAAQLAEVAGTLNCSRVLLDLQRPGNARTVQIAKAVAEALPCPVAVSACYAEELCCPVFLPPVPPLQPPQEYLTAWQQREIWLELALGGARYTVTEAGCQPEAEDPFGEYPHTDTALCCRYRMEMEADKVIFHVAKDRILLTEILEKAKNVTCLVGLYQELGWLSDQ